MPTKRGWSAIAAGLAFWIAARFIGSDDLHMVAVGVTILPILATLFVQWNRVRLDIHRHLSAPRVHAGGRILVTLDVTNQGSITTPFLLLEDALSPALGKPARLVASGVPPGSKQRISYSVMTRHRGRYTIGPLTVSISDPFGLARIRMPTSSKNDFIVYPAVEELEAWTLGMQGAGAGESTVRHLFRSAAEFYTMREYVTGDDLRRIHWPSVARTNHLMIRQDESTRRSMATIFLDNRSSALGVDASPAFEKGVSVAASIGRLLVKSGFAVHLATLDSDPAPVSETGLLETLASVSTIRSGGMGESLSRLRSAARSDSSLALVTAPPQGHELAAMSRIGAGFGRKLVVLVYPVPPSDLPDAARIELETRASVARGTLLHGGWEVFVISPDGRLAEVWRSSRRSRKLQVTGSLS
jgi:uncharacterized protein (DUF58 family)